MLRFVLLHTGQDEETPSQWSMPMSSSSFNETVFLSVTSSSSSKYWHSLDGTLIARGHFTLWQIQHALYGVCTVLQCSRILCFPLSLALQSPETTESTPGSIRCCWGLDPSMAVHHGPLLRRPVPQHNVSVVPTFYNHCLSHCAQSGLSCKKDEARMKLQYSESSRDRLIGCIWAFI